MTLIIYISIYILLLIGHLAATTTVSEVKCDLRFGFSDLNYLHIHVHIVYIPSKLSFASHESKNVLLITLKNVNKFSFNQAPFKVEGNCFFFFHLKLCNSYCIWTFATGIIYGHTTYIVIYPRKLELNTGRLELGNNGFWELGNQQLQPCMVIADSEIFSRRSTNRPITMQACGCWVPSCQYQ